MNEGLASRAGIRYGPGLRRRRRKARSVGAGGHRIADADCRAGMGSPCCARGREVSIYVDGYCVEWRPVLTRYLMLLMLLMSLGLGVPPFLPLGGLDRRFGLWALGSSLPLPYSEKKNCNSVCRDRYLARSLPTHQNRAQGDGRDPGTRHPGDMSNMVNMSLAPDGADCAPMRYRPALTNPRCAHAKSRKRA